MGNRAVIAYKDEYVPKEYSTSIYLHWNGGRDSVEAFLKVANDIGVRASQGDYAMARLTQIISNYFGGILSVGVGIYKRMDTDNYDNGVYWISNNEKGELVIVDREFKRYPEQKTYKVDKMAKEIMSQMPEGYQQDEDLYSQWERKSA
jgi:hypothetical protein